jgi:hypothetical protein
VSGPKILEGLGQASHITAGRSLIGQTVDEMTDSGVTLRLVPGARCDAEANRQGLYTLHRLSDDAKPIVQRMRWEWVQGIIGHGHESSFAA